MMRRRLASTYRQFFVDKKNFQNRLPLYRLIPAILSAFVLFPPSQGLRRDKTAGQAGIHVPAQIIAGMTSFSILRFSGSKKHFRINKTFRHFSIGESLKIDYSAAHLKTYFIGSLFIQY